MKYYLIFFLSFLGIIAIVSGILYITFKYPTRDYMFYIHKNTSKSGISFWIVRDVTLNSVYMRFAFQSRTLPNGISPSDVFDTSYPLSVQKFNKILNSKKINTWKKNKIRLLGYNQMVAGMVQNLPPPLYKLFADRSVEFQMHGSASYITGYIKFMLQDNFIIQTALPKILENRRYSVHQFSYEKKRLRQVQELFKQYDTVSSTLLKYGDFLQNLTHVDSSIPFQNRYKYIKYWSFKNFRSYYKQVFIKNNLNIVVYGNLSDDDARKLVDSMFGTLPLSSKNKFIKNNLNIIVHGNLSNDNAKKLADSMLKNLPSSSKNQPIYKNQSIRVTLKKPKEYKAPINAVIYSSLHVPLTFNSSFLYYSSTPFSMNEDNYIKALLLNIYLGGDMGILNQTYRDKEHLTYQAYSSLGFVLASSPLGILQGYMNTNYPDQVQRQLRQSFRFIKTMQNKTFVNLKQEFWNSWIIQFSDPRFMTRMMLQWKIMGFQPDFSINLQYQLNTITKEDLISFAKNVFFHVKHIEQRPA